MSKITNMRKVKQDDKFSLAVREIQSQHPANKKCFDCEQRGPTYLNMTIGSFVCTKCSGMLRGEQIKYISQIREKILYFRYKSATPNQKYFDVFLLE